LYVINNFELKKVNIIINIKGSKYSCIKGSVSTEARKKYNKIRPFLKLLPIKISTITQEIKKEK